MVIGQAPPFASVVRLAPSPARPRPSPGRLRSIELRSRRPAALNVIKYGLEDDQSLVWASEEALVGSIAHAALDHAAADPGVGSNLVGGGESGVEIGR